jgi:hypothetical protein
MLGLAGIWLLGAAIQGMVAILVPLTAKRKPAPNAI